MEWFAQALCIKARRVRRHEIAAGEHPDDARRIISRYDSKAPDALADRMVSGLSQR
jgi:hypothetical protein